MRDFINRYSRYIASFFLLNFLAEVFSPTVAFALTSGPSQPEVQEFQAINVSDMVDPSTGDFSYNLPLFDVDGYPVNLSYRAGIAMDQEASYVGLGWNMNVGSIARGLRGIPDEFNGDEIVQKFNMKENVTYGITAGIGGELFGIDALNASVSYGLSYNNYTGYDFVQKIGFSLSLGDHTSVGLGLNSSADGLTISPNLSFQASSDKKRSGTLKGSASLGTSYNSRSGIKEITGSAGVSYSYNDKTKTNKAKATSETESETAGQKTKNDHSRSQNIVESGGGGSAINFGSPTYIPQITMPMHTSSIMGSFKLGGTVFGVDVTADISGNYSRQSLKSKIKTYSAYGYLNLHNGQGSENAMLDFNREKDGTFTEATTNLPIPNLTYDNYSVMGQGVGGQFRPFRSEVGYVFDPRASNTSESNSLGVEIKIGNLIEGGADFVNTTVEGSSGKWSDENSAINALPYSGSGSTGYEPAYFKEMGEMNFDDDPLYQNIQEAAAARFKLSDKGKSTGISEDMISENSVTFNLSGTNKRSKRIRRNKLFSYLTVKECEHFALQTSLYSQIAKPNNGHHIGQITTTRTDGTRFVYGLPVYNTSQKEVSFNISGFTGGQYDAATNMVLYTPGTDDKESNSKGVDNFFTSTETPLYAYAHLLTAVLSSDYVDKTGDGPSKDDIGTYTLFKYNTGVDNYEWRAPQGGVGGVANYATLDPGLLTDSKDDKASYLHGKKDIRYLTSIESKNHIAILTYSDRNDGRGVPSDAGGVSTGINNRQKQLDLITLYSMNDFVSNSTNAYKIKQVHLTYNYELCKSVYNFSGSTSLGTGKLTLKSVYFTFGNSNKGVLSPYKFNYNLTVNGSEVPYNPASTDRWGNYKPNATNSPNYRFPYVEQDKSLEDQYISLWNLKSIQLPSGGEMEITYESDDYAYIQNKRAGEMFKIVGCSNTSAPSTLTGANELYNGSTSNNFLFFRLKPGMAVTPSNFKRDYLNDLEYLYFRFFINVNNNATVSALNFNKAGHEFIHGYAEVERDQYNQPMGGISTIGGVDYGYVKVKAVRQSKSNVTLESPISKTAWQFARLHTPRQAYNSLGAADPAANSSDIEGVLRAIASSSFIKNTIQTFQGYNGALKSYQLGKYFWPDLSWIRLSNPDFKKLGGGLRVKQILIKDKWDKMLNVGSFNKWQDFQYGQQYEYTTMENSVPISSGVASYEPTFGADENSFRKPVFMEMHKQEALLAPDNDMYVEEPLGESFFPAPCVIYNRVEVKSLVAGTGKTVHEYYTSRDFPTIVHDFGLDAKRKRTKPIWNLFTFSTYDRFTGSQGYSIELNDMAGKPKALHSYEEGAEQALSSTTYLYKRSGDRLVNSANVVSKNGSLKTSKMGIDYDFYADFRENNSYTEAMGIKGNLYTMMVGVIPILLFPTLPTYHSSEVQLRTAVTNKVIYHYGILDKIVTKNGKETSTTENLLWDEETGQVLLTGVTTEFEDPLYNISYPGHWAYEGLAGGYKNTGLEIPNPGTVVNASGQITDPTLLNLLYPGDEIAIIPISGTNQRGYVDKIGSGYFFTENTLLGTAQSSSPLSQSDLNALASIKVVRSGRHNLQDQKVGAITSFVNPLQNSPTTWPVIDETYGVTNASAIELGSTWQGYCGCDFVAGGTPNPGGFPNQYVYGIKGNQRKTKDYAYLTNRKQTKVQGNSNIRVDGTLEKFSPFWTPNAGNDWVANTNNWTWVTEATKNSPYGFDLENKDALDRSSSAQYGYNQSLPVAVTSNSKYKFSANENFEYNDLNVCEDNHFGFNQHAANTYTAPAGGTKVQKYSHTGKRSIRVAPGSAVNVIKQINPCN